MATKHIESYDFEKRTTEWVLSAQTRMAIEELIEKLENLIELGGKLPMFSKKKNIQYMEALGKVSRGKAFDPEVLQEMLLDPVYAQFLHRADCSHLAEAIRHGRLLNVIINSTDLGKLFKLVGHGKAVIKFKGMNCEAQYSEPMPIGYATQGHVEL